VRSLAPSELHTLISRRKKGLKVTFSEGKKNQKQKQRKERKGSAKRKMREWRKIERLTFLLIVCRLLWGLDFYGKGERKTNQSKKQLHRGDISLKLLS